LTSAAALQALIADRGPGEGDNARGSHGQDQGLSAWRFSEKTWVAIDGRWQVFPRYS